MEPMMNDNQRLQLQNMIKANNTEDQTDLIRQLKHSVILTNNIQKLVSLKQKHGNDLENLKLDAMIDCSFLFTYYTDIYNKIIKDELNMVILYKFLEVLKQIEEGQLDQHDGSYRVGVLLKEMYVDSALKKAEKLNANNDIENYAVPISINWKQYKRIKK
jgi:hypothetical protein